MTLMDINDDCLIEILRCLSVEDLLSVSEVSKRFGELSVAAFKSVSKKKVTLSNLTVKQKLVSLKTLCRFGSSIQRVKIEYGNHRNEEFFHAIIDKGNVNLIEVTFSHQKPNGKEYNVLHVWRSVRKIFLEWFFGVLWPRSAEQCSSDKFLNKENIARLNKKFRNLRILRFECGLNKFVDSECIEQALPSLEHLIFYMPQNEQRFRNFIKSNPQVKSLPILLDSEVPITSDLMEFFDENLPQLEQLFLIIEENYTNTDSQRLFLKNLKRIVIVDKINESLPLLSQLSNERMEFMIIFFSNLHDEAIDRIFKFKELKILALHGDNINFENLMKFSENLPKLSQIFLNINNSIELRIEDVVRFIQESKQLKAFFLTDCSFNLNDIKEKLDLAEWRVNLRGKELKISNKKRNQILKSFYF